MNSAATVIPLALAFGPFILDRAGARLLHQGHPVGLAPRPWAVLLHLIERPGSVVSKDDLLDAVWGHRHVSDSVLKVTVNALRHALGDDAKAPQWLHTVSRRGYRFTDAVRPVVAATGSSASADDATPNPARTAAAALGNLPAQGRALVGRAEVVTLVRELLAAHQLVTLTGPGGVGKTSLALHVAAFDPPPDGVWLLRLEPFTSAEAIVAAVARTVGLPDSAGRSVESLARALAPLRLRLVLDNAEHLVDALAVPLATCLMGAPGLQVLVTSQRPLHISGERRQPIWPLALPTSAADAADCPAVALLLQRVQAMDPDWRPDADALRDAAAIARALDGLPLALELAAVRVPLLGMAGVRERLDARLKLLTHGPADAPDRHRTLRAALEWSVGLLPPPTVAVLERLSVFSASFNLAAATAVAAPGQGTPDDEVELLDAIQLLRDMALVVPAEATGSASRLRMYDSVRLLALERLTARGEDAAARARLRRWLTGCFDRALDQVSSVPQTPWLVLHEPEIEHLQSAMTGGLAEAQRDLQPDLLAELVALGGASVIFCVRAGLRHLSAGWLTTMRGMAQQLPPLPPDASLALDVHTALLASPGLLVAPADGLAAAERAWPVLLARGRTRTTMYLLYNASHLTLRLNLGERLLQLMAELRAIQPADANLYERRLVRWLEVLKARSDGSFEPYNRFCAELLAESQERGDGPEGWNAAWGLGQALYLQGRSDEAAAVLDSAVNDVRARGRLRLQGPLVAQAAVMRLTLGAGPDTLARLREAVQVLRAEGMLWWLVDALSWVPLWEGREADARRVQAWADSVLAARGESRGPVFARLRADWERRIGPSAAPDAAPLDEEAALRLAHALPEAPV